MDPRWLDWVVCPRCLGHLDFREGTADLWCPADRLAFPVREGIPVLLLDEALGPDGSAASVVPDPQP